MGSESDRAPLGATDRYGPVPLRKNMGTAGRESGGWVVGTCSACVKSPPREEICPSNWVITVIVEPPAHEFRKGGKLWAAAELIKDILSNLMFGSGGMLREPVVGQQHHHHHNLMPSRYLQRLGEKPALVPPPHSASSKEGLADMLCCQKLI